MANNDSDFMCDDYEDYGLEYSEESNDESTMDMENQYYVSKALKEEDQQAALDSFEKVLHLENGQKCEWGFKALKQKLKIYFGLNNHQKMMACYKQLLTYINGAVTRNHAEISINNILDHITASKNMELVETFYETTLNALKDPKDYRLWFNTNMKLAKIYFDQSEFVKLQKLLEQLHQTCQTGYGEDDPTKGPQLLEIYALEIQMYSVKQNTKKLKTLYEQSLRIESANSHPLIIGIIRECGGKMHLRGGDFGRAHTDFFEAFKSFDEAGSMRRIMCLKLNKSGINPFDAPEAKLYINDPEIFAIANLLSAYQQNDVNEFESILRQHRTAIMADPFLREHIDNLLRDVRKKVLIQLVRPYERIAISLLAFEMKIEPPEVEYLLVSCIQDGEIHGKIDQVNQMLLLDREDPRAPRYNAVETWARRLESLQLAVLDNLDSESSEE